MATSKKEMLQFVLDASARAGVPTAIGGGLAVAAHGYRRDTSDVDAFFHDKDRSKVMSVVRKSVGPRDFVEELDPSHFIVIPEGNSPDERIDLMFAVEDPEASAIEMSVEKTCLGITTPVFRANLLVAAKFLAGREDPKDALDISSLLRRGAYEVEDVQRLLVHMGFEEAAREFPKLIEYLENLPRRPSRRRKV